MRLRRRTMVVGAGGGLVLKADGLTRYATEFVVRTKYSDLPADVIELGKKSILDGLGLALAGSVAKIGQLTSAYLASLGNSKNDATVIGSPRKAAVRFAPLANGVRIHADDYHDTQLAAAKGRGYRMLAHPTSPCLPAALAVAGARRRS